MQDAIRAPQPPDQGQPFRFPVLATLAPMVAAVVMWLVTSSPFALAFAALGPVTAVASLADSRIGSRRTRKRELARFDLETIAAHGAIESAHSQERLTAIERTPPARTVLSRTGADPYRWRASDTEPVLVSVGTGEVRSALRLDGVARADGTVGDTLAELERAASVLDAAPVAVDARLGIGVVGPRPLAAAVARAIAVQLAWALSPQRFWCACAEPDDWMTLLPHRRGPEPTQHGWFAAFGVAGEDRALILLAVADAEAALPGACGVVLRVGAEEGAAIVQHPDRLERRPVRVEAISRDEAAGWAQLAAIEAQREGLVAADALIPAMVGLGELGPGAGTGLSCAIGADAEGPVVVDLVSDGPHAVIGGTTGSGKSELLVSWVIAMAAAHSPEEVVFLLVDFKGGSAFAPLQPLPRIAGVITDLDAAQAARALASLRAELRYRERRLAEAGVRGIDDGVGIPRLVIVVDEFAAMLVEHPDLHALFSDIAARGRSLGVHLVLCTQRPAGVVRDAVLANADLRISLRVNNRADSSAVVGTDAAASIPAAARGRGILALADGRERLVQFAIASPADAAAAGTRWASSPPIRRPWCEPLPAHVDLAALEPPAAGIPFGLVDLPDEQRIATAAWHPQVDGNLLVLGAPGSGKSTVLETIAAGATTAVWLPTAVDAAWDALLELEAAADVLLLADDLDSLLSRFGPDHRQAFIERLGGLLRDGAARGIRAVIAAQRLTAELQSAASLIPARLWLAHASRQDFVVAGGEGASYLDRLPAGGGIWRSDRIQVALGAPPRPAESDARVEPAGESHLAIVSSRAGTLPDRLRGFGRIVELAAAADPAALLAGRGRTIIIGDIDEWQSRWGALGALRPHAEVLFEGCSVADYRALTRSRELPPPLSGAQGLCWRLEPDGTATRVRLPGMR